ncbi:hypothetical protein ACFL3D_03705, partial [Candidatus Omnitrophota bacterium]
RSIIINKIVTAKKGSNKVPFYLTRSPYCSSMLEPDTESLSHYIYSDKFAVEKKESFETITLEQALEQVELQSVDWFKTDSQGIDLVLFKSIPSKIEPGVLVVDMEPGLIDAYKGEDLFITIHKEMTSRGFWLANMNVCGTPRIRKETAQTISSRYSDVDFLFLEHSLPRSPGWCEIRYFRTLDYIKKQSYGRREYILLWAFALLAEQIGFAAEIMSRYETLFTKDALFEMMEKETLFRVRRLKSFVIKKNSTIAIFGTGVKGQEVAKMSKEAGVHVAYFFDNNKSKSGSVVNGIDVITPDTMQEVSNKIDAIIVASQWESDIYYQLLPLGIEDKLYFSVVTA